VRARRHDERGHHEKFSEALKHNLNLDFPFSL
jgi:hypothetical protein